MGFVHKTARKEHDTPTRVWFRCLVEEGFSQTERLIQERVGIRELYWPGSQLTQGARKEAACFSGSPRAFDPVIVA